MYELLLELCKERGISVTNLCLEITGSRGNLATWKKGNINPTVLSKIADYFQVSTDYLLGRVEKPNGDGIVNSGWVTIGGSQTNVVSNNQLPQSQPQFDETTNQVAEAFKDLNLKDKVKVMSLITELSEKKGA